jgi:protein-serine/threonine kinase
MDDDSELIYSTPLPPTSSTPAAPPPEKKPADYVYYERRPDDLSSDARARATAVKVKLQSHYRLALETAIDLNVRCVVVLLSTNER